MSGQENRIGLCCKLHYTLFDSSLQRRVLALLIILAGILGLLYFGAIAPEAIWIYIPFTLEVNPFLDAKLKYHIATFVFALVVLTVVYGLFPNNARRFYGFPDGRFPGLATGKIHAETEARSGCGSFTFYRMRSSLAGCF